MFIPMELNTRDTGEECKKSLMEYRLGPMVPSTRATGLTTWRMEKEPSTTPMATYTMESGSMIKLMGMAFINTEMGRFTRANGLTICNTVRGKSNGLTKVHTMGNTETERSMGKVNTFGLMETIIVENG